MRGKGALLSGEKKDVISFVDSTKDDIILW